MVSLIDTHPENDGYYPGLAKGCRQEQQIPYIFVWTQKQNIRTEIVLGHRLFLLSVLYEKSYIQAPWYNDFYSTEKYPNITIFDEHTISRPTTNPNRIC